VQGSGRDSRRRAHEGHGCRLQHGLANGVQRWSGYRCLDRSGPAANRHGRGPDRWERDGNTPAGKLSLEPDVQMGESVPESVPLGIETPGSSDINLAACSQQRRANSVGVTHSYIPGQLYCRAAAASLVANHGLLIRAVVKTGSPRAYILGAFFALLIARYRVEVVTRAPIASARRQPKSGTSS